MHLRGKGKSPPAKKPASPGKKKFIAPKPGNKNKNSFHILVAGGFHPIFENLELATFVRQNDEKDGYMYHMKQLIKNVSSKNCDEFEKIGFYNYVTRRVPFGANDPLLDPPSYEYNRILMVRYLGNDKQSTPESREEMFKGIKYIAQHREFNDYPVKDICKMDISPGKGDKPLSLDQFFMDTEIEEFIKRHIEEEDLNDEFYTNYPELSDCIYRGGHPSPYASNVLGFTT